jgi:hypothetical protein
VYLLWEELHCSKESLGHDVDSVKSLYLKVEHNHNGEEKLKTSYIILTIVIVVIFVGLLAGFGFEATQQPHIVLTDISYANPRLSCCFLLCPSTQYAGAYFSLVNSGSAAGYVDVLVTGGGQTIGTNTYYVPAGETVQKSILISVDCSQSFDCQVSITAVRGP